MLLSVQETVEKNREEVSFNDAVPTKIAEDDQ